MDEFLLAIAAQGGMSFSNNFLVRFEDLPSKIGWDNRYTEWFCNEAQLPDVRSATGSQNGLYTGLGNVDYIHTRLFTEFQIGFQLDVNMEPLKFLNNWYGFIFNEEPLTEINNVIPTENRVTRLRYRNQYAATIRVIKSEMGPDSPTQRQPVEYVLEKAYPFAIDAVPLQFGTSQITQVTAQFKYQRHYIVHNSTYLPPPPDLPPEQQ